MRLKILWLMVVSFSSEEVLETTLLSSAAMTWLAIVCDTKSFSQINSDMLTFISAWPGGPAQPDDDPMDRFGHGTHVAGIIAGKSEE